MSPKKNSPNQGQNPKPQKRLVLLDPATFSEMSEEEKREAVKEMIRKIGQQGQASE